jgi:hypothetical protein
MDYKIKMYCTDMSQLMFNNTKIDKNLMKKLNIDSLNINNNIKEVYILKKYNNKNSKMCIKSLEIICNFLSETDFILFITHMQLLGFVSNLNSKIQFIYKNTNEIMYEYKFQTITKQQVKEIKPRPNISTYNHMSLYKN